MDVRRDLMTDTNRDFFHEPAKSIPVYRKVDVVVAGGGPGGIGAAIAAAS